MKNLTLPALRGMQATKPFYVVVADVETVIAMFAPIDATATPEERAQRALTKSRVGPIADYVIENPTSWTFASLVGAIDGAVSWVQVASPDDPLGQHMGLLKIPASSRIHLLDGQHRRAGLEEARRRVEKAVKRAAFLGEHLAVQLYPDTGLRLAKQRFADLNSAKPPNASLKLLYNGRDEGVEITRSVMRLPIFAALTDGEKTSATGKKLFAFKSLHTATSALVSGIDGTPTEVKAAAVAYWSAVVEVMSDWRTAASGAVTPAELRDKYVHAHGVTLQALGLLGKGLLSNHKDWKAKVALLARVEWARTASVWNGRCIVNGRMMMNNKAVELTANVLRTKLGLPLSVAGRKAETSLSS